MGYSADDSMVRVDFFTPNGKWQATEAVKWTGGWSLRRLEDAFAHSLREHFAQYGGLSRFSDLDAICLEPYHENAHPIQLKAGAWLRI